MVETFLDKTALYKAVADMKGVSFPERMASDGHATVGWVRGKDFLSVVFLGGGRIAWASKIGECDMCSENDTLKEFLAGKLTSFLKFFMEGECEKVDCH